MNTGCGGFNTRDWLTPLIRRIRNVFPYAAVPMILCYLHLHVTVCMMSYSMNINLINIPKVLWKRIEIQELIIIIISPKFELIYEYNYSLQLCESYHYFRIMPKSLAPLHHSNFSQTCMYRCWKLGRISYQYLS